MIQRIKDNRLKWNIKKSFFGETEMEYLGFWVTRTGIRPINKKLEAIVNMKPSKNTKEVCAFNSIVMYYKDMWDKRSHLLQPLTAITSHKVNFKWTDLEHKQFDDIKRALSQDTFLAYPDYNRHSDIHTDKINYQLRAVISQNIKPIAFCSQNLTGPQTRYTVTNKELLSIIESLKEFHTLLLGQKLKIYYYHKNLT